MSTRATCLQSDVSDVCSGHVSKELLCFCGEAVVEILSMMLSHGGKKSCDIPSISVTYMQFH